MDWSSVLKLIGLKSGQSDTTSGKSGISGFLGNLTKALPLVIKNGFNISAYKNDISSAIDSATGANLTGAEIQQNAFNAEQAQLNRDWQTEMSNTAYQRQVADMQAAGVNPAVMYGGAGASGASTPAGNAATGSAHAGNLGDVLKMLAFEKQLKNMDLQNAGQEIKNEGEQIGNEIKKSELSFADAMNAAKLRSYTSNADLNEEQIKNAETYRLEMLSKINLNAEQAKTEGEKRMVYQAESLLKGAQEYQIYEMMDYQKAYLSAQTENDQAQAYLAGVEAALKNGLISHGYIENFCKELRAQATTREAQAEIDTFEAMFRTGQKRDENGNIVPDKSFAGWLHRNFEQAKLLVGWTGIGFGASVSKSTHTQDVKVNQRP